MNDSMSSRRHTASMVFDAEDKVIVGRVLDIDAIIAFHGESVAGFEARFHAAIDAYITACAELAAASRHP